MKILNSLYEYRQKIINEVIPEIEKLFLDIDSYIFKSNYCLFPHSYYSNIYYFIMTRIN